MPKVKKITLCGSTKFKTAYEVVNRALSLQGFIVYSVACFTHADSLPITEEQKKLLDEVHKEKIWNSDGIFVIDVDGYIGASTQSEIDFAKQEGKSITFLSRHPDLMVAVDSATFIKNKKLTPEPTCPTISRTQERLSRIEAYVRDEIHLANKELESHKEDNRLLRLSSKLNITDGIRLIAQERHEQIHKHGRTLELDREFNQEEQLGQAAVGVILQSNDSFKPLDWDRDIWDKMIAKPYEQRLIIAGALIAAEIDRIKVM